MKGSEWKRILPEWVLNIPNLLLIFNSLLLFALLFRLETVVVPVVLPPASSSALSTVEPDSSLVTKIEFERAEKAYQEHYRSRNASRFLMSGSYADQRTYFIRPVYPCPWESRIGGWTDGGKWFCMLPVYKTKPLVVYSIGSNGQTEFEEEMWRMYQTKTFTFDPTLRPEAIEKVKNTPFIEFQNVGLTGEADLNAALARLPYAPGATMMHIDQAMKSLGHTYVDIFKIDCELCEEGVFNHIISLSTRDKPLFGQISLEIHATQSFIVQAQLTEKLESIGYRLFHAEAVYYFDEFCELFYLHESLLKA